MASAEAIASFMEVTGATKEAADFYLTASGGVLDAAIHQFLEGGGEALDEMDEIETGPPPMARVLRIFDRNASVHAKRLSTLSCRARLRRLRPQPRPRRRAVRRLGRAVRRLPGAMFGASQTSRATTMTRTTMMRGLASTTREGIKGVCAQACKSLPPASGHVGHRRPPTQRDRCARSEEECRPGAKMTSQPFMLPRPRGAPKPRPPPGRQDRVEAIFDKAREAREPWRRAAAPRCPPRHLVLCHPARRR